MLDAAAGGKFRDFGRGKQSIDETQALADDLGMDYAKLTRRSLGQAYNAEQALAARQLLAQSGENLVGLARKARGGSDEDLIAFQRAFFRHVAIQEHVAGVTREAGRALNSFKITARTEKARLAAIEQTIRGAGGRENIEALADMLGEMDGPQAINKFAREASKAKTSDKVLELWINGLLSGPQTHAVNMLSNTLTQLWTLPEHTLAATFGAARKSNKVLFREGLGRRFGLVQGAKDGVRLAGRSWLTEEPTDSTLKVEARKYQAIPSAILRPGKRKKTVAILRPGKHKKTVIPIPFTGEIQVGGKQARIPGRALMAADEFFKAVGYRSELNALAIRNGVAKGLKGRALAEHVRGTIENPPEDLSLQAKHAAAYLTYTNPLGPGGQAVQKFVARYPAARIIAPFIRTPTNIIKFASERTPFGLLMRDVRDNLRGKNGKVARDLQAARMALGSTVGIAVAALAAEGHITGGGPSDPKARAALFATGWQPYSVKIGDGYHAFSRLEPAGMILGVSADFAEIAGEITKEERDSVGAMILGSITKNLVSKTWLRSMSDLVEAVHDPDRYGERYIQRLAGTMIPTDVAQVARVQDPVLREARSVLDHIKSRTGYSKTLSARRNVWGDPIILGGGLGPDLISPIYTSKARHDPVADEIVRLKLTPSKPPRKVRDVELSPAEYEYVQLTGRPAKQMLERLVTSAEYQQAPDWMKKRLIQNVLSNTRAAGRTTLLVQNPEILRKSVAERASKFQAPNPFADLVPNQ